MTFVRGVLTAGTLLLLALPVAADDPPAAEEVRGLVQGVGGEGPGVPKSGDAGGGFAAHVREALAVNRRRADVYAELSDGRSRCLSRRLILYESLVLPYAHLMDWRADDWNDRGIGVVRDDFVSMSRIRRPEAPVRWSGQASPAQVAALEERLSTYEDELDELLEAEDLRGAAARTLDALHHVEALEERLRAHFAMTRHVLEQIGYAAVRGVAYAEQSDGATRSLSACFVEGLSKALARSPDLDARAQELHTEGVGILVNDLPPIPFEAEWEGLQAGAVGS